jgi:hypothetical protein
MADMPQVQELFAAARHGRRACKKRRSSFLWRPWMADMPQMQEQFVARDFVAPRFCQEPTRH